MTFNYHSQLHRITLKAVVAIVSTVIALVAGITLLQVLTPFMKLQMEALQSDILAATTTVVVLYTIRGVFLSIFRGSLSAIAQRAATPSPTEGPHT